MRRFLVATVVLALIAAACSTAPTRPGAVSTATPTPTADPGGTATAIPTPAQAAGKIRHVVIIMQENRSFDSYFGTYPGADGLPTAGGKFTVCVNDPATGHCVYPFHDAAQINGGGPHGAANATADFNGGKMDGFIARPRPARSAAPW